MNHLLERMRQGLKLLIKGRVLWRFLITYLILIVVMSTFLWNTQMQSLEIVKERTLDAVTSQQRVSISLLESELLDTLSIHTSMEQHNQFARIRVLPSVQKLENSHHSDLRKIKQAFRTHVNGLNLVSEAFLYFTKNGSSMSTSSICTNGRNLFDNSSQASIFYQNRTVHEILQLLNSQLPVFFFLPSEPVSFNNTVTSCVTLLVKPERYSVVLGFLIREDHLLNILDWNGLEGGSIRLIDSAGNVIVEKGSVDPNAGKTHVVSTSSTSLGLTLKETIPESQLQGALYPLRMSNALNLIYVLLFSLVISLILSLYNAYPTQKLAQMIENTYEATDSDNEFAIIRHGYLSAVEEMENLNYHIRLREDALRISLLTRLLSGGTPSANEEEIILRLLPQLQSPYRVLVAEFYPEAESYLQNEYLSVRVNARLQELLPENFACVQLDQTATVFLLPASLPDEARLAAQLRSYMQTPEASSLSVIFGLSNVYHASEELSSAFLSSKLRTLQPEGGLFIAPEETIPHEPLEAGDLSKLALLVRSGNQEDINALFERVIESVRTCPSDNEDWFTVYYAIVFALRTAARGQLPETEHPVFPGYNTAKSPSRQFVKLQGYAVELSRKIQQLQDDCVANFAGQIQQYIEEHFSDPLLDVDRVAEAMHISRSVLYRQLKDTDMPSVAKYIHSVRMKKAMELLSQTSKPISEIASDCGYTLSATFTRAFQKTYGIVPSAVRKN